MAMLECSVVTRERRMTIVNAMNDLDMTIFGHVDDIKGMMATSRKHASIRITMLGIDVDFHLFIDSKAGAIVIDGYVFEKFKMTKSMVRDWHGFLVEMMVVVMNAGIFNYIGTRTDVKNLAVESIPVEPGDVIIKMPLSMPVKNYHPIVNNILSMRTTWSSSGMVDEWQGCIPVVVRKRKLGGSMLINPGTVASLLAVAQSDLLDSQQGQADFHDDDFDDFFHHVVA